MKDLITIETLPAIPENWDYNTSVAKVKQLVYKWREITLELATELWIAREKLSVSPQEAKIISRDKSPTIKTWTDYCVISFTDTNRYYT